ncbi:AI-2E family transporter [Halopseudomonas aestusnigri]|uniref:AI-2E family transporter n=1 Tax=Halopseudomonas TaxID=2901189 RepID=UPI001D18214F|nr:MULTISPECIES: AI-2E family transporter [Halopseudomonas]MCC4259663.1 AI-2E family transporter [Halopseudomonas aestusnigri]MCK5531295.1 AI-2E family transporter [Halopseudomonas aestusnigri]UGV31260.1 AI-2E family transporter [Halopseudomonas aestusnigri]BDX17612.1 AI-2E family transporter [Halopseudomonas aestusnigri]
MSDHCEISGQGESGQSSELPRGDQSSRQVLIWLLALACLYTLYFAKTLLLPVVVAALFALLLSPLVALFKRFHVPRTFSALLLLTAIGGPFTLLGTQLAEPAEKWIKRLPELSAQLSQELDAFGRRLAPTQAPAPQEAEESDGLRLFGWFREEKAAPAPASASASGNDPALSDRVMQGGMEVMVKALGATPAVLAQFFTFLVLVLFMLIFGPSLYSTFIRVLPQVRDKHAATELLEQVQRELSRYILTVSLINTLLGAVTAGVLMLMGVEDALLWGVMVGLLNFAPYVGPVIGMLVLCLAGVLQYGPSLGALLPALVFFCINLVEAQFITPTVLGQRMRLHPLVLMLWLILWGWLWGVVGVLIAVPLLVCLKLAADRLNLLPHWVKLIESPI